MRRARLARGDDLLGAASVNGRWVAGCAVEAAAWGLSFGKL